MYAIAMPSSVRPHGAPGSRPGPHSRYQPATSSTNGSSQRPVPKYGTARLRHQSVRAPCPGSIRAMRVTAPRTSRTMPMSDRTTAGDSPIEILGRAREREVRRRLVVERVEARLRWAI